VVLVLLAVMVSAEQPRSGTGAPPERRTAAAGQARTVAPEELIRQRSGTTARSLALADRRIRTVRDARRKLDRLPAGRKNADIAAAIHRLERQEQLLSQVIKALHRWTADSASYSRDIARRNRIDAEITDVDRALTALRAVPLRANTPYLRAATRRLSRRRKTLHRERTSITGAIAGLERRLVAPLPS
jgi:hypothetical protein